MADIKLQEFSYMRIYKFAHKKCQTSECLAFKLVPPAGLEPAQDFTPCGF